VQEPEAEQEAAEIRRREERARALRRPRHDAHLPVPTPRRERQERPGLEGVNDEKSPEEPIASAETRHAFDCRGAPGRRVGPYGPKPSETLRRPFGGPVSAARAPGRAPAGLKAREAIGARTEGAIEAQARGRNRARTSASREPAPPEAAARRARARARSRAAAARAIPSRPDARAGPVAAGWAREAVRTESASPRRRAGARRHVPGRRGRTRPARGSGRRVGARTPRMRPCPLRGRS
jgi:hypothetical protein